MPINYWCETVSDCVEYSTARCLKCYGEFIGPAHNWRFCPLCGTQWLGQWPLEAERQQRRDLDWKIWERQSEIDRARYGTRLVWCIEKRDVSQWKDEPIKYSDWQHFNTLRTSRAVEALAELRHWRKIYSNEHDDPLWDNFRYHTEYRLKLCRN